MCMREYKSPYSESICSAIGTSLRSARVRNHIIGPFANESDLYDFLLSLALRHSSHTTSDHI